MPYSSVVYSEEFPDLDGVRMFTCGTPADAHVRGIRYHWSRERMVPCNRWVCEQCHNDLIESYDARLRVLKRQVLTREQETAWDQWYDRYGHTL